MWADRQPVPALPAMVVRMRDARLLPQDQGTYAILHEPTSAVYIGATGRSVRARLYEHRATLRAGSATASLLQELWSRSADADWWVAAWPERSIEALLLADLEVSRRLNGTTTGKPGASTALRHTVLVRLTDQQARGLDALSSYKQSRPAILRALLVAHLAAKAAK